MVNLKKQFDNPEKIEMDFDSFIQEMQDLKLEF